jgi:hypothetical protein
VLTAASSTWRKRLFLHTRAPPASTDLGPKDRVDEVITKRWCDPGREASGT